MAVTLGNGCRKPIKSPAGGVWWFVWFRPVLIPNGGTITRQKELFILSLGGSNLEIQIIVRHSLLRWSFSWEICYVVQQGTNLFVSFF